MATRKPKALRLLLAATLLLSFGLSGLTDADATESTTDPASTTASYAADTFLVRFVPGTPSETRRSVNAAANAVEREHIPQLDIHVMTVPKGKSVRDMVAVYSRNPNIQFAEPDYLVSSDLTTNDPYFNNWQAALKQTLAPAAWDATTGSAGVVIAVLDTGINAAHPDLTGRVITGYNFVASSTNTTDDNGHGTRVAGIIGAASNNGVGIAGATWSNPLLPVKVMDSTGSGTHSNIAKGLVYAVDQGARVINLSVGGTTGSSTLKSGIDYAVGKGSVAIASAGNSNTAVEYPAAYANVIAVGAVDSYDVKASYSCYGPELDVTAPGSVMSTLINGTYGSGSGTSFSAPFVSGLAGLLMSAKPTLTPSEVKQYIQNGADDLGAGGIDPLYGYGRINMGRSLSLLAAASATPTPTPSPTPTPVTTPTASAPAPTPTPTLPPDTIPPEITLLGATTMNLDNGTPYVEPGATAMDAIDGNITSSVVITGSVDTAFDGTYTLAYDVADKAGNKAVTQYRTINVLPVLVQFTEQTTLVRDTVILTGTLNRKTPTKSHVLLVENSGQLDLSLAYVGKTPPGMTLSGPSGNLALSGTSGNWQVEPGSYTLTLNSSLTLSYTATFTLPARSVPVTLPQGVADVAENRTDVLMIVFISYVAVSLVALALLSVLLMRKQRAEKIKH